MAPAPDPDLLTPADVRRLLRRHGLSPRKTAGQHFVVDPNTVRKIVRDADVTSADTVLEVGSGLGSLTLALAAAARRVVTVEVDRGLVAALREVLASVHNVEVVHADALQIEPARLLGGGPARVVANLPYRIATPLLFHLLACPAISDAFVMVQREVGQRWAAGVGDAQYGAVSVKLALVADVELVARVPRTVFHPVPNVDSVTVWVRRRADRLRDGELEAVVTVIEAAFAQRRKTLRNALGRLAAPDQLAAALAQAGVDPTARAEQLDVAAFRRVGAALGVTANARP